MIARTAIRRGLRLVALAVAVVVALFGLLAGAFRLQFTGAPAAWAKSTGNDALRLDHDKYWSRGAPACHDHGWSEYATEWVR